MIDWRPGRLQTLFDASKVAFENPREKDQAFEKLLHLRCMDSDHSGRNLDVLGKIPNHRRLQVARQSDLEGAAVGRGSPLSKSVP